MGKILLLAFVVITLALSTLAYNRYFTEEKETVMAPVPSSVASPSADIANVPKDYIDMEYENAPLRVGWIKVANSKDLSLFSNLEKSQTAEELLHAKSCKYLVNAGFYSKEDRPIGIFISEGEKINNGQRNTLFNGVFSVNTENKPVINSDISGINFRFGVQAGPVLIKDSEVQNYSLKSDSDERRTVVALTGKDEVVFLTFFNPESFYRGPTLEGLPTAVRMFERKTNMKFTDALNLDGGTASAFYSDSLKLSELSPIGSYFCIKS